MPKSAYKRAYEIYLKELIDEVKEEIIEKEGNIKFTSIDDIPERKSVKEYLLKCAKEHCPDMNPVFIDIFMAIHFKTNEPIDGGLLRLFNQPQPSATTSSCYNCIMCNTTTIFFFNRIIGSNINYKFSEDLILPSIVPAEIGTKLTTPCNAKYNLAGTCFSFIGKLVVVRPEYIKYVIENWDTVFSVTVTTKPNYVEAYKYIEHYNYLNRCMDPKKLGTINFIKEPKEPSKEDLIKELVKKIDELSIKIDNQDVSEKINEILTKLNTDTTTTTKRSQYLKSIV